MYSHFNSTSPTKTASAPNSTTLSRTRFVSSTTRSSWSTRIYPSPLTSSTGVRFWAPPSRPVPSFKPCAINRRASDPPRDLHRPLHKSPTLAHAHEPASKLANKQAKSRFKSPRPSSGQKGVLKAESSSPSTEQMATDFGDTKQSSFSLSTFSTKLTNSLSSQQVKQIKW